MQGQVVANATADAVWAKLQEVPDWPRMFTDIKTMTIVERGTAHYCIKLETRTFDCGPHEYHGRFGSPRTARHRMRTPMNRAPTAQGVRPTRAILRYAAAAAFSSASAERMSPR